MKPLKKTVKIALYALIVVLLGVFLFFGYKLTSTIHNYNEADRYYTRQSDKYVRSDTYEDPSYTKPPSSSLSSDDPVQVEKVREVSPRTIDFDAMIADCADAKAWLYGPDTVIDYPVVQASDNQFYLYRFMDGTYNPNGTLFIDFRCEGDFSGLNTVIYGHHMQNGSMLASIVKYRDQEYYDAHPVLYLNTPDGDYRLDVFTGFVTWYDSRVYMFSFESKTEFVDWYTLMKTYSDFDCDVEITPDDRIVTLSTCTYDYDNARYVLMAKLVPLDKD